MTYVQTNSPFLKRAKPPAPSKKKSLGYYNKAKPTGTGGAAGKAVLPNGNTLTLTNNGNIFGATS